MQFQVLKNHLILLSLSKVGVVIDIIVDSNFLFSLRIFVR